MEHNSLSVSISPTQNFRHKRPKLWLTLLSLPSEKENQTKAKTLAINESKDKPETKELCAF